jgi:hypothetical protein
VRVRYRNLSRSFDHRTYASNVSAAGDAARERYRSTPRLLRGDSSGAMEAELAASITGLVSTPSEVSCEEGEAELEDVRAMLARGELEPTDLVDIGEGWQTLRDCYPFEEQCDAYDRLPFWRRYRRNARAKLHLEFEFRPLVWSWIPLYLLLLYVFREPFRGQGADAVSIYAFVVTTFLSRASLRRSMPAGTVVAADWSGTLGWTFFLVLIAFVPFVVIRFAFDVSGVPSLLVAGLLGGLAPVPQFLFQARLNGASRH